MYALKAREKLHKRQKDDHKKRHSGGDRVVPSRERRQPSTTSRDAKVPRYYKVTYYSQLCVYAGRYVWLCNSTLQVGQNRACFCEWQYFKDYFIVVRQCHFWLLAVSDHNGTFHSLSDTQYQVFIIVDTLSKHLIIKWQLCYPHTVCRHLLH